MSLLKCVHFWITNSRPLKKWFRRNTLTLKSLIKPFTFIALNRLGDFERRMQVCKLRIWNHKIHMYINCILILSCNIVYLSPVCAFVTNMGFLCQSYAVIASCKRPFFFLFIIIICFLKFNFENTIHIYDKRLKFY